MAAILALPALAAQTVHPAGGPGRGAVAPSCDSASADRLASQARQPALDPAEAGKLLAEAYRACPARNGILLEAARALARARDFDRAVQLAREFLDQDADSVPGLLVAADIQLRAQRFEDASSTAAAVLRRDPGNATAMKLLGNSTYFLGQSAEAEGIFLRLLDRYPADTEAAYMLGRIYYQENRFGHAAAQFQKVVRLDPRNHKAYDNLGLCHEALGETEKAIQHFLAAIQIVEAEHPDYDWPYANLASLLIDQGDLQRGYEAAGTAARRNPYSARNFYLGGKALAGLERIEDARKWLERSARLDPAYTEPVYLLARIYGLLGEDELAKRSIKRFRELKAVEPDERR